ncbi:MAG: glutamylcysteine synthetase [Eubacterium sp.]|nr:glutamylcysteine synthetase [Eubacterium sp.]
MIQDTELLDAIYQKYIRPTERPAKQVVGVELEYPIVNLKNIGLSEVTEPVDFDVVHRLAESFVVRFGFDRLSRDDDGEIYLAEDTKTGDSISFDCSFNTLELSFGIEENICFLKNRFDRYYSFIEEQLLAERHTLTGMGINPGYRVNRVEPIHNGRYRMLLHHLESFTKYGNQMHFHHYPHFGLFSCASQVQVDAEKDYVVEMLNTFNRLEPLKALLFANSTFDADPSHRFLASRDYLWKNSLHGLNPHNVDEYDKRLHSLDEIVRYISSESLYCLEREGKYINFPPVTLADYYQGKVVRGEYYDTEESRYRYASFEPQLSDLAFLRSFKFNDLTFRGTVEFRSVCEQPIADVMSVAAFHAGLLTKLPELTKLLNENVGLYQQGFSVGELRETFVRREHTHRFDDAAYQLIEEVLCLAEDGLVLRGHGEESFLEPLFLRAEKRTNPALQLLEKQKAGRAIREIILSYAENR